MGSHLVPRHAGTSGEHGDTGGGKCWGKQGNWFVEASRGHQVPGEPVGTSVLWKPDVDFPQVAILQQKADPRDLQDPLCGVNVLVM